MVQVVRARDVKRSERARPTPKGFKGLVPMAEPPSTLRSILLAARDKARGLKKAMENPDAALKRAADEPIDQDVLMAPYAGKLMKTKH